MAQSLILRKAACQLPNALAVAQLAIQRLPHAAANALDRQCMTQTICTGSRAISSSTLGSSTRLDCSPSTHALSLSPIPAGQHHCRCRYNRNSGTHPMHSHMPFSTAAVAEEPSTIESKSDRSRNKKDPITITLRAAERVFELLSSPNAEGALGIRLGVKRRGCNGLSYTLNYAFERKKGEEEMAAHGLIVLVEPMALFSIVGTVMDYEETDLSSEFTFINPNSKGECGCGESFNV